MPFDVRPRIRRAFRLALRRPDLTEAEVDAELRFHIESRVDQLMARGLTREAAEAEARRRFGTSWDDALARLHDAGHAREERLDMTERLDAVRRDLSYVVRTLRRQPAFAIVVVLTFALGIGANATMFGVIDRLLLRPPPQVGHADQLFEIGHNARFGDGLEHVMTTVPYPLYATLRADTGAFARLGAATFITTLPLGSGATATQAQAAFATSDYFPTLETTPALGRFFTPAETGEAPTADIAIISYGFWERQFGRDRAVVGKSMRIGTRNYTVIGVARRGFTGVEPRRVDLWLPLPNIGTFGMVPREWPTHWGSNWVRVYVRLRPGVTFGAVAARAGAAYAAGSGAWSGRVRSKGEGSRFEVRSVLPSAQLAGNPEARVARLLLAVSAVVLLIACANVAGLLLARGTERRREIAVRLALGVSRARLMRLLVAETVVLATCGGVVAVVVAHWGLALLHATLLADFAWTESAFDARVLAATVSLILATTALAGLAPAWRSSSPDVVGSLKAGARAGSVSLSRTRASLMVVQAALSVVLIVGAGLFVQSLRRAARVKLGYERDRVIAATVDVIPLGYTTPARLALYSALRDRVAAVPGVASAAIASTHPLQGWGFGTRVRVPGRDSLPQSPAGGPYYNAVGADYFATLGLRIVDGRPITNADVATSARVAVVSETMARAYWPGERALHRCLMLAADSVCTTIVGVAADAGEDVKGGDARFLVYRPITPQTTSGANAILVRGAGSEPRRLVAPIRRAMQTTAANLPFADVQLMEDLIAPQIRPWKMGALLFSLFGALALLIASVGLYSAISYGVTQRRHELGVRIALGAQADDVIRLVLVQGVRATVGGVLLGSVVAMLAGRFVLDLLFHTSPKDPVVFVTVGALMLAVAVVAAFFPAWRASRVDPATALRAD
jgi:predicted permease